MTDHGALHRAGRLITVVAVLLTVVGAFTIAVREDQSSEVQSVAAPGQDGACRNSTDPACGPFRWDPQPTNRPMTVVVTPSNRNPRVGEPVTFTVEASDDAKFFPEDCGNDHFFGDALGGGPCDVGCVGTGRYGPWDPPAPTNDRVVQQFTHTYERAGTFEATFLHHFGERCVDDPYESDGQGAVSITVTPAAAPAEPSLPATS